MSCKVLRGGIDATKEKKMKQAKSNPLCEEREIIKNAKNFICRESIKILREH